MNCALKFEKRKNDIERSKRVLVIVIISFFILITIGIIGFSYLFGLNWFDSLYAATLVITGINIEVTAITTGQKWFVIIYSIFAVIIYLSMANAAIEYLFQFI